MRAFTEGDIILLGDGKLRFSRSLADVCTRHGSPPQVCPRRPRNRRLRQGGLCAAAGSPRQPDLSRRPCPARAEDLHDLLEPDGDTVPRWLPGDHQPVRAGPEWLALLRDRESVRGHHRSHQHGVDLRRHVAGYDQRHPARPAEYLRSPGRGEPGQSRERLGGGRQHLLPGVHAERVRHRRELLRLPLARCCRVWLDPVSRQSRVRHLLSAGTVSEQSGRRRRHQRLGARDPGDGDRPVPLRLGTT